MTLPIVSAGLAGFEHEQVLLCFGHVEKKFGAPQQHVQTLCHVYQVLASHAIPHAVRCIKFKAGSHGLIQSLCPLC